MNQDDVPSLLGHLASEEDAVRKMAVFKLQASINDPAFADFFISSGGLTILRELIMSTGGNTLAYSLQSLSRLLEVDMGWEIFENSGSGELVERLVELIVTHPLVNILRGAMSILVAVVSHPQSTRGAKKVPGYFGFRALKPAVAVYPQFFGMAVSQLSSADHALCANALMLLNALMRDSITQDETQDKDKTLAASEEWPKFIKRLQDLGVIKSVYVLLQSSALQDLAQPLLDFQALSKVLLQKWKAVRVDLERPEHRKALKSVYLASSPNKEDPEKDEGENGTKSKAQAEKWRRLGFQTESPAWDFEPTGFLGMMDLTDYVRKNEDGFQKLLQEQSTKPSSERCPLARASLAVTAILYEHFEVDKSDLEDAKSYLLDGLKSYDKVFRPLLLQWSRLHTAGLQAFLRLWKSTGANLEDFDKVAELVRILIDQVVGQSTRTKDIHEVEEELAELDYTKLRELQMELMELSFEDEWGQHLQQVRDELRHEALQFVKEQRIRCLLQGAWFSRPATQQRSDSMTDKPRSSSNILPWRFARLSHNRRFLHYDDFEKQVDYAPKLGQLHEKIDLGTVSSVVSNVSTQAEDSSSVSTTLPTTSASSAPTLRSSPHAIKKQATTKITINSYAPGVDSTAEDARERPILTLSPPTHSLASEWLDGLLMLLNQAPITAETNKLVNVVSDYGLKIRLLNVRMEDAYEQPGDSDDGFGAVPSRAGLDEDYFYEI